MHIFLKSSFRETFIVKQPNGTDIISEMEEKLRATRQSNLNSIKECLSLSLSRMELNESISMTSMLRLASREEFNNVYISMTILFGSHCNAHKTIALNRSLALIIMNVSVNLIEIFHNDKSEEKNI